MKTKTVFLYDENNAFAGVYLAQESPLEPDNYITPVRSTEIEPPSFTELQACHFIDGAWVVADKPIEPVEPVIPPTIEQIRAQMPPLTRVQFVIVLRKNNLWEQAKTIVDASSVETQVKFYEGQVFERLDETLNALAGQLALSDSQVDDLFNEGYQY